MPITYLDRARSVSQAIAADGLRRVVPDDADRTQVDFASNDYLGLSRHPSVTATLRDTQRVGSGGSRLLSGAHPDHAALETELATWLGRERCLLFSSGYLAALGAIHGASLVTDLAHSDAENHACIIDALRLTKLPRRIFTREEPPDRARANDAALIITESVFGMSGKTIDASTLLARAGEGDLLLLDEAHALGVLGERGAGLARAHTDPRIVVMGTLSKAFGCHGGLVAGPAAFIELLVSTARSFIFDTALPPALANAARAALRLLASEEGDKLRARLRANIARVTERLPELALPNAPILPIPLGDPHRALDLAERLRARGFRAPAIRPPTIPPGTSRLRLVIRADHTEEQLDLLAAALREELFP